MGLMRKVPAEMAELTEQERGEPDTPNRFASARFVIRVQPDAAQAEAEDDARDADSDPDDPEPDA